MFTKIKKELEKNGVLDSIKATQVLFVIFMNRSVGQVCSDETFELLCKYAMNVYDNIDSNIDYQIVTDVVAEYAGYGCCECDEIIITEQELKHPTDDVLEMITNKAICRNQESGWC